VRLGTTVFAAVYLQRMEGPKPRAYRTCPALQFARWRTQIMRRVGMSPLTHFALLLHHKRVPCSPFVPPVWQGPGVLVRQCFRGKTEVRVEWPLLARPTHFEIDKIGVLRICALPHRRSDEFHAERVRESRDYLILKFKFEA
jgi:hypothetical protein